MKQIAIFLIVLLSMVGIKAYAYDFAVENTDGVTIYYRYINDGKDLEVTYFYDSKNPNYTKHYSGNVVIPEDVTYMNRTRKVTCIGEKAFSDCSTLTSVTIPNSVSRIKYQAFEGCNALTTFTIPNGVVLIESKVFHNCSSLTSVTIGNSVTKIENEAFSMCKKLTSVTIGNNVKIIGDKAFYCCYSLTSVTIPNSVTDIWKEAFADCSGLTSVAIGNSVKYIGNRAFYRCSGLTSLSIPNSVTSIGESAFDECSGLTSVTIGNSVTSIGWCAFRNCSGLTSVTIPNSVTSIGKKVFDGWDLPVVISLIENPFSIAYDTFSNNTFKNATLYVPVGTIDKYKSTDGWKGFLFIEEGTGEGSTTTPEKCEKPSISYSNGILTFTSATEGATCQYNIADSDVKAGSGNEVKLTVTYNLTVYATKTGYDNSETVTATLCWIDVDPRTEGIENSIAGIRANPVLIQSNGGVLNISGIDDGTDVVVYSVSGQMVGTSKANGNQAIVFTNIRKGEVAIVKIGDKSVKVLMQ